MQRLKNKILSTLFLSMICGAVFMPVSVQGADPEIDLANDPTYVNSFSGFDAGNVANDPRILIKRFINVVMGFLGMLAVLTILYGGFKWMTAGGNKENTEAATKLLINGVIGLVIIFSAWTLAWFLVGTIKGNVVRYQ